MKQFRNTVLRPLLLMRTVKRTRYLLVALRRYLFASAFANEAEGLSPEKWPETVEAATQMIISRLPEKDRLLVKNTRKEDLMQYHHGWGTGIRNYYGL